MDSRLPAIADLQSQGVAGTWVTCCQSRNCNCRPHFIRSIAIRVAVARNGDLKSHPRAYQ
jgi:hypothetical protein